VPVRSLLPGGALAAPRLAAPALPRARLVPGAGVNDRDLRIRERDVAAVDSPEARARVLVDRLRSAPMCAVCHGARLESPPRSGRRMGEAGYGQICTACASGQPFRDRLELAAYCGDAAARIVCPDDPRTWGATVTGHGLQDGCPACGWALIHRYDCEGLAFKDWSSAFVRWGPEVQVRAAVAAARAVLPAWCDGTRLSGRAMHTARAARDGYCGRCTKRTAGWAEPGDMIEAAEAWLAVPTDEVREYWHSVMPDAPEPCWTPSTRSALGCRETNTPAICAGMIGEGAVRAAIQAALTAWALA
jgi:hypothetical protein